MANSTDKSILTAAGKALLAQLNAEEKALVIDKMIFANVPNRPEYPQPDDVVPTDHIVHQEQVEQRGRLSADSVIYSTTLTSDVGPFDFNWTGAYCSEYGVLVTIDHHALTPKTADEPGVAGNTLVRSVVLEYKDIAEITNITVDASSWQYNATERMKKMDSDVAQSIIDQNGKDWFIEDGFLVTPSGSAYSIKAGAGYVSGNRVAMEFDRSVQVPNKPSFIYIDAHREGTPTGEQVTLFNFVVTAEEKDDYIDSSTGKDVKHFVCKIAQVYADGSVSDLRPEGESASRDLVLEYSSSSIEQVVNLKIWPDDIKGTAKVGDVINIDEIEALRLNSGKSGRVYLISGFKGKGTIDEISEGNDFVVISSQKYYLKLNSNKNHFDSWMVSSLVGDDLALKNFCSSKDELLIIDRHVNLSSNITIPKNKTIWFYEDGRLSCNLGALVNIKSRVISPTYPIVLNGGSAVIDEYVVSVGSGKEFSRIQSAISFIPQTIWQNFKVQIHEGRYDEDVRIDNIWSGGAVTGTRGERCTLTVYGVNEDGTSDVSTADKVLIKSLMHTSCGGASFHPATGFYTVYGKNPRTNEGTQIEFYGCPAGATLSIKYRYDGVPGEANGLMAYGSTISSEAADFGEGLLNHAYITKHGGHIFDNSNTAMGMGPSPVGHTKNEIGIAVSGTIHISDSSGLTCDNYNRWNVYGAGNGFVYDQGEGSMYGPMLLADSISAYHSFFSSIDDATINNVGTGETVVNQNYGFELRSGNVDGDSSSVLIRRLNSVSRQKINNRQALKAAIFIPDHLGRTSFEIGIGAKSIGQPYVYILVEQLKTYAVFRDTSGNESKIELADTSFVVGRNLTFEIDIMTNRSGKGTHTALGIFRLVDANFIHRKVTTMNINTDATTDFMWSASARCEDHGAQLKVYLSELRLYRSR